MRLQPGDAAPGFEMTDLHDRPIRLEDYRGRRLMLAFFRYASCPFCNLRVSRLIGEHEAYSRQGLDILAFFQSPRESILRYVGRQEPPFPIIPDPHRTVYRAYEVESSWGGFLKAGLRVSDFFSAVGRGFRPGKMEGETALIPADFLIGPDLTVARAYYGSDIGDHMPLADIGVWLKEGPDAGPS